MKRYLFSTVSIVIATAAISAGANAAEIKQPTHQQPTLHQQRLINMDIRNKEELKPTLHQLRMAAIDERNKSTAIKETSSTTTDLGDSYDDHVQKPRVSSS
ncbi:hypothetical protein Lepto7375DRAFT_7839 [Leptolyngbya sp. PCC 7375]|nr:hypothetical protein Lepto7375DRAFT_7839 [Leptolyngbya sp. PCC 7375]